ncbi:MAG: tetratricopeptide repeat protein [Betaproteobacteria bacterium]|nr:tetratricopeptide repeat protein [Betaproteobacteria bacterium]
MTPLLPPELLSRFAAFLAERTGLHFPPERWRDLERAVRTAAPELGFDDAESCIRQLLAAFPERARIEILASHLTVGETYFFREPQSFEILERHILPELIASRRNADRRLRIWSAGCATGEEPYSIAILLDRLIPDLDSWNVTILATDINPRFLEKASGALYGDWSFRAAPGWMKDAYFTPDKGGRLRTLDRIRRMVTFSYLNLAEDVYPALANSTNAMDVIFCRNVLMYFGQEWARRVIAKLYCSLVEGGWLLVSPVEASNALFGSFAPVGFSGGTIYRKSALHRPEPVSLPPGFEPSLLPPAAPSPLPPLPAPEFAPPVIAEAAAPVVTEPAEPIPPARHATPYEEALALYGRGHYAEAAERLLATLPETPADIRGTELLVRACSNQGRLDQALEWCEKAIAADKLNPGCHYLLAAVRQEQGQFLEAAASLKRALYLDPNFVMAHFALGNLARRQGRTKESARHFANALSLLGTYRPGDMIPESEGITAGRLMEIVRSMSPRLATAEQ